VALGTYLAIFALVLAGFAVAISFGFHVQSGAGTAGVLGAAYVATKVTQPLRIGATLVLTPVVAKVLSRFGEVVISNPGGDRIGRRPVDLHVDAMRAMGATIDYRYGYYYAKAPGRLRGTEIRFPIVSVMSTENTMLAATLADGHTVIRPAAQEPEVDDLIAFFMALRGRHSEIEDEGVARAYEADFRRRFDLMSLQRNLKALGTFGYQTTTRQNPVYIQYMPRTLNHVRRNLGRYPRFGRLRDLLATFVDELG
jgi:hypothetical protein